MKVEVARVKEENKGFKNENINLKVEIKGMKEEVFIAKGLNKREDIDHGALLQKIINIKQVLSNLNKGKTFDLDLLTGTIAKNDDKDIKMVHFNKELIEINTILCDIYAKRFSENADCMM